LLGGVAQRAVLAGKGKPASQGEFEITRVIHAYPTQAQGEAIKKAADAYNRTRLTPTIQSLLRLVPVVTTNTGAYFTGASRKRGLCV